MLFTVLSVEIAFSQETNTAKEYYYEISYYGYNLVKPGIKTSANYILKQKIKSEKINTLITNAHIGFTWYPHSHFAVFNYYQIAYRKTKVLKNKFFTIALGPGVYRSIYSETYQIASNGYVEKINFAGRTYFSTVLTLGNGKILKKKILKSRFINTNLMFLFDYNTSVVPLLSIEIGFRI